MPIYLQEYIYIKKTMPPKIERYSTEPKGSSKFVDRFTKKPQVMVRTFGRKVVDIKRFTVSSNNDNLLFKDGEMQGNQFLSFQNKKKSFIVSKRKNNKSTLSQAEESSIKINKNQNTMIEKVQSESYQGLRPYNQDRILIKQNLNVLNQNLSLFAVFDGHGGSSAAEYLKINFVKTFQIYADSLGIHDGLKKSIQQLQSKIIQSGNKIGSGSCASVLVIKMNQYWAANVGDSRILIIKGIQQFVQVTEDHKPQNPKQYKRIQNLGGKVYRNIIINQDTGQKSYGPFRIYPSKLSVSRAIGDYLIKKSQKQNILISQPDIYTGKIDHNNVFLVISDGVYQQFSSTQLSILFSHQTKESLRQRICNYMSTAKKRGTNDNASLIAIQIKDKNKQSSSKSVSTSNQQLFQKITVKF